MCLSLLENTSLLTGSGHLEDSSNTQRETAMITLFLTARALIPSHVLSKHSDSDQPYYCHLYPDAKKGNFFSSSKTKFNHFGPHGNSNFLLIKDLLMIKMIPGFV
jgi:hypothetical protein